MGMSKVAWVLLIVLVVGVLGGFMVYKSSERSRISGEAKAVAYRLVDASVGLNGEEVYVRSLIDLFHDEAFGESFDSGGFTNQSLYDEEVYLDELWTRVGARAHEEGQPEVADALPHFEHHRDERVAPTGVGAT